MEATPALQPGAAGAAAAPASAPTDGANLPTWYDKDKHLSERKK